jgi:hypothetical protein
MSGLTDRMRTCAAYILQRKGEGDPWAVDLLVEASNMLSVHEAVKNPQGDPVEILEPVAEISHAQGEAPTWVGPHDTLPQPRSPKACPQCDSRAHKKVFRQGRRLMLACPVCAKEWPYG